jgi:hypothetical protein
LRPEIFYSADLSKSLQTRILLIENYRFIALDSGAADQAGALGTATKIISASIFLTTLLSLLF